MIESPDDAPFPQSKTSQLDLEPAAESQSPQRAQFGYTILATPVQSTSTQTGPEFELDGVRLDDAVVQELLEQYVAILLRDRRD